MCRSYGFRTSLTKPATVAKVPRSTKLQSKGQSCCGGVRTCAASSNHSLTLNARHSMVSAPRRTPARFLHNAEQHAPRMRSFLSSEGHPCRDVESSCVRGSCAWRWRFWRRQLVCRRSQSWIRSERNSFHQPTTMQRPPTGRLSSRVIASRCIRRDPPRSSRPSILANRPRRPTVRSEPHSSTC